MIKITLDGLLYIYNGLKHVLEGVKLILKGFYNKKTLIFRFLGFINFSVGLHIKLITTLLVVYSCKFVTKTLKSCFSNSSFFPNTSTQHSMFIKKI
ncbi:hypothetical protein C1H87_01925 [Flavivirga eckloniae]|uniref:Uncharacterized protein n=1 Tax=Flavivirga eckloniae TaxID=1803846 RepID=A0A2K9PKI7_9FLAO|nr:hypothetical protein C1H87_01925 [Flavivirga eckloniae]